MIRAAQSYRQFNTTTTSRRFNFSNVSQRQSFITSSVRRLSCVPVFDSTTKSQEEAKENVKEEDLKRFKAILETMQKSFHQKQSSSSASKSSKRKQQENYLKPKFSSNPPTPTDEQAPAPPAPDGCNDCFALRCAGVV
jgi:hypothetical protein